jgi:hypothetical protein
MLCCFVFLLQTSAAGQLYNTAPLPLLGADNDHATRKRRIADISPTACLLSLPLLVLEANAAVWLILALSCLAPLSLLHFFHCRTRKLIVSLLNRSSRSARYARFLRVLELSHAVTCFFVMRFPAFCHALVHLQNLQTADRKAAEELTAKEMKDLLEAEGFHRLDPGVVISKMKHDFADCVRLLILVSLSGMWHCS